MPQSLAQYKVVPHQILADSDHVCLSNPFEPTASFAHGGLLLDEDATVSRRSKYSSVVFGPRLHWAGSSCSLHITCFQLGFVFGTHPVLTEDWISFAVPVQPAFS